MIRAFVLVIGITSILQALLSAPITKSILYFLVAPLKAIFLQLWWNFLWIFLTMSHSVRYRETPLELKFSQLLLGAIALMSFVLFYILNFTLIPSFGIDLRCCTHVGQFAVDHRLYVGTCNKTGLLVYSQIISATLIGFWVYGCWPNGIACFGMSVIVTCGALLATSRLVPTSQCA